MKKLTLFYFLLTLFIFSHFSWAQEVVPTTNQGKKWRVGYLEGGTYINYSKTLVATIENLMKLGWIESAEVPKPENYQTEIIWDWLVHQSQGSPSGRPMP